MFGLSSLQGLLLSAGLSALLAGIGVGTIIHKLDNEAYEKLQLSIVGANVKAANEAQMKQRHSDALTEAAEIAAVRSLTPPVLLTQTLIREVPKYVTVEDDKRYALPLGFCILHDAAAAGIDPADTPEPAPLIDDVPCEVSASEAVSILIQNYGEYHKVALQLIGLQNWVIAVTSAQEDGK